MTLFSGVGVALITPFKEDLSIDYKAFEKLINHVIEGGVDYLVVQGTTGESATLDSTEKNAVLEFAVEITKSRVPIVYGYGGNDTRALINGLELLNTTGVSAFLSASPYYNKPTQTGIYKHYKALSDASPLPIILYNVPGRTASNIEAETTLRLASDCANIVAIKEASGDLGQMSRIIKGKPESFTVLSGDDDLILPQLSIGASGVISVIANAFPAAFSKLVHAGLEHDFKTARALHYTLSDVIPLLFKDGNPAGVKEVLKMLGIAEANVRLPLDTVTETTRNALYRAVSDASLLH